MIRSLNDWYAASETSPLKFHYWCNCLGELNIPGKDTVGSEEELPADIRELYEGTWGTASERYGVNAYVISFDNKPGIGLTWLFDSEFQKARKYASDEAALPAIKTIAEHIQMAFPQADIFVGENTDMKSCFSSRQTMSRSSCRRLPRTSVISTTTSSNI